MGRKASFTWRCALLLLILHVYSCCCQDFLKMMSNRPIENRIILIKPSHFEQILESNRPYLYKLENNTEETLDIFLDIFPRFMISFDFKNETDASYDQLERILMRTGKYNQKMSRNSTSTPLQIWISIVPQDEIALQLEIVAKLIQSTNIKFGGLVPAFILNYRAQRLGSETLPLVRQDIHLAKQLLQRSKNNVIFGIILDARNCLGTNEYFHELMKSEIDVIFFMTATEIEPNPNLHYIIYPSCINRLLDSAMLLKISVPFYGCKWAEGATINDRNLSVSFTFDYFNDFLGNQLKIKLIPVIQVNLPESKTSTRIDPVMKTLEAQEKWLKQEAQFSNTFTGISMFGEYKGFEADAVIPLVWSTFCRVLVQKRGSQHGDVDALINFVDKLLEGRNDSQISSQWKRTCGGSATEIYFAGNVAIQYDKKSVVNEYITMLTALTALAAAADEFEGVSSTIILDWEPCGGLWFDCKDVVGYASMHILSVLIRIQNGLIERSQFRTRPNLAISLNPRYCHRPMGISALKALNKVSPNIKRVMFRFDVDSSKIISDGALAVSQNVILYLQLCPSLIDLHTYFTNVSLTAYYNILLTGCASNTPGYKEAKEIARFWELIDKWAVSVNATIFIGSAIQRSMNDESARNCTTVDAMTSAEHCDCGWWTAFPQSDGGNATFELLDKKTVALRKFEQLYRSKPSSGDSSGSNQQTDILAAVLIPAFVLVLSITSIATILVVRYKRKKQVIFERAEALLNSSSGRIETDLDGASTCSTALKVPYDRKRHEISANNFKTDTSKSLGAGESGTAFPGTVNINGAMTNVAVKTFQYLGTERNHESFLALKGLISEIKILSYVGHHQHIVHFVGAHTQNLKSGKLFVFLELCELGSLFTFLRNVQPHTMTSPPPTGNQGIEMQIAVQSTATLDVDRELLECMHRWSFEIAAGMEFLSSKKMVHADLSTRNILLNAERCAKIADFGLSRRLYDYTEYIKREAGPLPWRWMPPECLRKMMFNEKTDVWSFGITLWEIFSLADEPYPGLSWDVNFPILLEMGTIPSEPRYNEKQMYNVMKQCWKIDPAGRPTFAELISILENAGNE